MSGTPESTPVDPGLEPKAKSSAAIIWVALISTATAVNVVAVLIVSSAVCWMRAGQLNQDRALMMPLEAWSLLAWALSAAVLIIAGILARNSARPLAFVSLAVCLVATPVSCGVRTLPGDRYAAGFRQWAAEHVNAETLRQWDASLPPATAVTEVPSAEWPPGVASLSPNSVERLPNGRGVVIRWGIESTWGTSRKVFVARDPTNDPPPERGGWSYTWAWIGPGVYAGVQIQM